MFSFFEIAILIMLFILNIIIEDYHLYYLIIYLCVITYTAYKIYLIVRIFHQKIRFSSIVKLLISYIFSYYVICDPNPIYYLLTLYLPFQNFFRMVFLVILISYQVEKLSTRDMDQYLFKFVNTNEDMNESNNVDNSIGIHEENNKQNNEENNKEENDDKNLIKNSEENINEKNNKYTNKFFLSEFLYQFKRKRNIFFFILCTSIIQFCLFLYRIKYWILFTPKEKALPIATVQNTNFYIASIICNMQPKMEDYIDEMKKLINYLGPQNVMVSIIENGDSKDQTRDYLEEYQKYLNDIKVLNDISIEKEMCKLNDSIHILYRRIEFLARLRNRAFDLIYRTKKFDYQNTKIIYINDIIYSYEDIVKLLGTNNEDYDAVCAMDFNIYFYDTWASADLSGNSLRHYYPYFVNAEAQDQVIHLKPIRIFSCWGGVSIFPAAPLENKKLQFRTEYYKEKKYSLNSYQMANIESECTYINIDLQSLGYTKRFMNPDVKVAYEYKYYYITKYFGELYHFAHYFYQYFWKFTEKRNKNMSNLRDKFVKLEKRIEDWYNYHKLNTSEENTK